MVHVTKLISKARPAPLSRVATPQADRSLKKIIALWVSLEPRREGSQGVVLILVFWCLVYCYWTRCSELSFLQNFSPVPLGHVTEI